MNHQLPQGYSEEDCTQHGRDKRARWSTEVDQRSPFEHDVDRILYSAEFRSLAGKTQVVASDQFGNYHNRLTHSLKVAQMGKRMAVLLANHAKADGISEIGPNPDLVEAACLIHDIGHPPFGHIGEVEVAAGLDALWAKAESERLGTTGQAEHAVGPHKDGFQANAQNLRIATYLSVRQNSDPRGLHLTRALLDAAIKYPWHRGPKDSHAAKHWGCYSTEDDVLKWVLSSEDVPSAPVTEFDAPTRPIEEQIMDWADEVTYACHDVEDFYRAGLIPLDEVLSGLPPSLTDKRKGASTEPEYETRRFLDYLKGERGDKYDEKAVLRALERAANPVGDIFPYEDTQAGRGSAAALTNSLLAFFLGKKDKDDETEGRSVRLEPVGDSPQLTRYGARLHIDQDVKETCDVLNDLIKCYVINRPGLATQQQGQKRILRELLCWYADDPERLLPRARREEYMEHQDPLRAAADAVCSHTEAEAVRIYRRMSGIDYGQVTDFR